MNLLEIRLERPKPRYFFFQFPGEPVAWQRSGWNGKTAYLPKKSRDFQTRLGWACKACYPGLKPLPDLFSLRLRFLYAQLKGEDRDIDNLEKNVLDALIGVLWDDDCQVREVYKIVAPCVKPRIEVLAYPIDSDYIAGATEME